MIQKNAFIASEILPVLTALGLAFNYSDVLPANSWIAALDVVLCAMVIHSKDDL